ncbi:MAG TPA: 50S ribosomal protein L10 [Patescibacteria group bacterium]|nr:50S ribosomal protein L10 [Patescibacteria group bacterium]
MPKSKQEKEQIVKDLSEKLKQAKSAVIANQEGLTVNDSQELRANCRKENVDYLAVKKTLLELAMKEAGFEDIDIKSMQGGLAVAIDKEDEVAPARIISDFSDAHEQVSFQGGLLEGRVVSVEKINQLSQLPSKEELLGKMVGSIKAPISGLVNVLQGNLRGLINVLSAIKENK